MARPEGKRSSPNQHSDSSNAPEGAQASNDDGNASITGTTVGNIDNVSLNGSNIWFRSVNSKEKLDEKKDSVTEPVQEYFQQSITDHEDDNKANGPEISSSVACAAKVFWQKQMKEDVLKKKMEQASIPSNCTFLIPKKVNVEIWKLLSSYNRIKCVGT